MSDHAGQPRRAFADESYAEAVDGGVYVLAAVVFDPPSCERAISAMERLRGRRRTKKLHWNEMDGRQRHHATEEVAELAGVHVVAVGAPVPHRRQERARAMCLRALVQELQGDGIEQLYIEKRTPQLDRRDIDTIRGARYSFPDGRPFHVDHRPGAASPLFWAADIVAGAVRMAWFGDERYRKMLTDRQRLYELTVATDL